LSAYTGTPTLAYKQGSILTATPGQLVVMLYDGCLRFLHQAAYAMRDADRPLATTKLRRAEAIITELLVTLDTDKGGDIASRLQGIYTFSRQQLRKAELDQDAAIVDEVAKYMSDLRDAWAQLA
jgi:flagellar secretion chaperone FliS